MSKQLIGLKCVVLVCALLCSASVTSAQEKVAGTGWFGNENLADFGKLEFELHRDGKAIMHDTYKGKVMTVSGKWSQSGDRVVITFFNCEYQGTVKDKRISGTGRFTSDANKDTKWNFWVDRLGLIP